MSGYGLVLFLHLAALLGAIGTSGLAHFAESRLRRADAVADAIPWARLLDRVSRVFPAALVVLVASGAYLVDRSWSWRTGWVEAGVLGVVLLLANGAGVVGARNRALARELGTAGEGPLTPPLLRLTRRHPAGVASWVNTGLAIGVVFVMTTKPALTVSLAALAVAATLGGTVAMRVRRHG